MPSKKEESTLVKGVNEMFWMLVALAAIIIATIVLMLLHDKNTAWIVSNLGTVLVLGFVALLIVLGKADWVSSNKLVNRTIRQ
jgi:hypothetical protein